MPLPPPPATALIKTGKPIRLGGRGQFLIRQTGFDTGDQGHIVAGHRKSRGVFVAHCGDGIAGDGPIQTRPSSMTCPGEIGIFCQETITRVNGVGSGPARGLDQPVSILR